jgi:antitoxin MazE
MRTRIIKWGNSLGLRIPKAFAEEVQVRAGSTVDLSLEDGQLVVRTVHHPVYSLDDLLDDVTDDNLHAEVEVGDRVGGEDW